MNDLKIERMKKEPKYIAFSTQKGGAGKTTLTVLVASYLHYVMDYNVAVVDCDYPQHSIVEMRERDLKMAMDDLTSGFNIGTNYTLNPQFNEMTGFTEKDVRDMLEYYSTTCPFNHSVDELIELIAFLLRNADHQRNA